MKYINHGRECKSDLVCIMHNTLILLAALMNEEIDVQRITNSTKIVNVLFLYC